MTDRVELGDGLVVTVQGFGAMSLSGGYGPIADDAALRTLHEVVDSGITFLDTANGYGGGRNEALIGQVLAARREDIQVATKFGFVQDPGRGGRGVRGDREYVRAQIDGSLSRLGTDHVDLYYQHRVDATVPIEETVGAMAELVAEGKVLHLGLCEVTDEELRRAAAVHPIAAVQTEWNVVSRDVERLVVPTAAELAVGFVPYSPLSRQLLTGHLPIELERSDVRSRFPRLGSRENRAANDAVVEEIAAVAAEIGATPAQVALAWLYDKGRELGLPVVPIPGTRSAERAAENAAAAGIPLSSSHMVRLDTLAARVRGHRSITPDLVSSARE